MYAWLAALLTVGAIAAEGVFLGFVTELLLKLVRADDAKGVLE
jgi:hypothetical protein